MHDLLYIPCTLIPYKILQRYLLYSLPLPTLQLKGKEKGEKETSLGREGKEKQKARFSLCEFEEVTATNG